jgi:ABC-2 type transport system permease protein
MHVTLRNIFAVARREFMWRARTRTYLIATAFLVIVAMAVALAPVIIRFIDRNVGAARLGVASGTVESSVDLIVAFNGLLNVAPTGDGGGETGEATDEFDIVEVADEAAGRADVASGSLSALLVVTRESDDDLAFDLYTKGLAFERTPQRILQAAAAITIQDRLTRAGIPPIDQAALFAQPTFSVRAPDGAGPGGGPSTGEGAASSFAIGFALAIFIFMAIMLYGQWVAMSVAEEKSSRVMEIVLGAATPFQLLAGKVLGVGALGLLQYIVVFIPALVAIVFQDAIASAVLGGTASVGLPAGLTIELLLAFGVLFVLGFALYAALYAGAASLVSRQEDVNQIVGPLTLLSVAGYMVAAYAGTGLIDIASPLVVILSYVPFLSPYLMLSRLGMGVASPLEVVLAIAILAASIPVALWIAARLYGAGVLMYGQRPSLRTMFRVLRGT